MKSKKFPKPINSDDDRFVIHNHSSVYSMTFKSLISFITYARNNHAIPEGYKEPQVQFTQEGVDVFSVRTESQLAQYREEQEKIEYERLRDVFEPKPECDEEVRGVKTYKAVVAPVFEEKGFFSKLRERIFGKKKDKTDG